MSRWPLVGLAAVLLAVTGCTQAGGVGPVSPMTSSGAPTSPPVSTTSDGDLARAKRAAGLPDCPSSDPSTPARPSGLPDLTLSCLGGGRAVRLAGLRGTPLVINVWAQWCGPCRSEAPAFATVSATAGRRISLLGVDYDDPSPAAALAYASSAGWRYPQLTDPDRRLAGPLRVPGPPQTIFVDAAGTVVYRHSGPFTSVPDLRSAIRDHLGVRL